MLYYIALELGAALKVQHVPVPVVFGPEPTESITAARERIVISYAGPGADSFTPPVATHPNPTMSMVCHQGATLRIYARSNFSGAMWHDHAARALQIRDHVLAELDVIVRSRRNTMTVSSGGFAQLDDDPTGRLSGGAVYEVAMAIDRGVFRRTWEGDKRPEVTLGGVGGVTIGSTTKVSNKPGAAGTPPEDAETSC